MFVCKLSCTKQFKILTDFASHITPIDDLAPHTLTIPNWYADEITIVKTVHMNTYIC